jgi:hypothetical protein
MSEIRKGRSRSIGYVKRMPEERTVKKVVKEGEILLESQERGV